MQFQNTILLHINKTNLIKGKKKKKEKAGIEYETRNWLMGKTLFNKWIWLANY